MTTAAGSRDVRAFSAFLIDIDGTVVRGNEVLDGAPELLDYARRDGRRFVFLTNNSRSWPAEIAAWLTGLGLRCAESEVISAGYLAANRAAKRSRSGVYVLGSASLAAMVSHFGGHVTDKSPDVVLVGLDRDLSYDRLSLACRALRAGARLVAVNRDMSMPTERGLEPGAGVLLAATEAYHPVRALVCGKPSPVLAHAARRQLQAARDETLMIGDSLDSDMRMAERAGIAGALIATGVEASPNARRTVHPALAFPSLRALLQTLLAGTYAERGH